jgi:hypothetical protein
VVAAPVLGVGVPATFSLTVDLIPRPDRGIVAGLIAAGVHCAAAVFAAPWGIERFRAQLLEPMLVGAAVLAVLVFRRSHLVDVLARQHAQSAFGRGRFVAMGPDVGGSFLEMPVVNGRASEPHPRGWSWSRSG